MLIVGAAGVGKTRLAQELIDGLRTEGLDSHLVRASLGMSSIPFGALADLLPSETPETLWALFRIALRSLSERGTKTKPLILGVDDAHLLDEPSAALIGQATSKGIVVPVLTARSPEPLPEPIDRLWTEELVHRITLEELNREATEELLESVLGTRATPMVKNRAWELSAGNPLLLRELVLTGVGSIQEPFALSPSDRLVEIVANRIGKVGDQERAVLESVAVSNPLEVSLLDPVGGAEVLERLEHRRLITVYQDGRRLMAQFSHPLHGEVLKASMPRSRVRRISARLAEGLLATGLRRRSDLLRVAMLHLDSSLPPDPDLLLRGARAALTTFAHSQAERLARAAFTAGGDPAALLVLGEVLSRSERGEEADRVLSRVIEEAGDPQVGLRAVMARSHNLAFVLGRISQAQELAEEAMAVVPEGPDAIALRVSAGWAAALGGSFRDAIRLGGDVEADESAPDELKLRASVISTLGMVMVGEVEAAEPIIDRALELASRLEAALPFAADLLETNRLMGLTLMGRIEEAEALARHRYSEAVAEGIPEAVALWAANLGFVEERRGDFPAALRHLGEAAEVARRYDPYAIRGLALGLAAVVAAQMGDRSTFESCASEQAQIRTPEDFRTGTIAHRVEVWRKVLDGDLEDGAAAAARFGRLGFENDFANWATITAHDAVRLGYPELVADLLGEIAETVDGELAATMYRHALASIGGDGGELDSVAEAFASMGMEVYAMEAAAQAARAHDQAGERKAAVNSRLVLDGFRDRYPEAATPPLVEIPSMLTDRETQIARLAVRHTSPQIAEKLGISVRTVDNHLASVYTKLGIGGRGELARLLELREGSSEAAVFDR